MLHFEGEWTLPQTPEQLWPKLRDAAFLAHSIPDGTPHEGATRDRASCTVHPGFAFMRGSLDVTMEVLDSKEPTFIKFTQKSKGIGSSSEVETSVTLSPSEQGTKIRWTADVKSLGGLLKLVPSGLIRGAANKVIEDVWKGVAQKLQSSGA